MASLIFRIFLDDIALKNDRPYVVGGYQFKFCVHFIKSVKRVDDLLVSALLYVLVKIDFHFENQCNRGSWYLVRGTIFDRANTPDDGYDAQWPRCGSPLWKPYR